MNMNERVSFLVVHNDPAKFSKISEMINRSFPKNNIVQENNYLETVNMALHRQAHVTIIDVSAKALESFNLFMLLKHVNDKMPIIAVANEEDARKAMNAVKNGADNQFILGKKPSDDYFKSMIEEQISRHKPERYIRKFYTDLGETAPPDICVVS